MFEFSFYICLLWITLLWAVCLLFFLVEGDAQDIKCCRENCGLTRFLRRPIVSKVTLYHKGVHKYKMLLLVAA